MTELLSIILAAGEGTRMRSALPKVLHPVGGLPLAAHVLHAASKAGSTAVTVVIGPNHEAVADDLQARMPSVQFVNQTYRLGTGHAVREARAAFESATGNVVVLLGDAPLIGAKTISAVTELLDAGADIAVVGFDAADPTGYGRMLTSGDQLAGHPRAQGCERGRARRHAVQLRYHWLQGRDPATGDRPHREQERQGRVLPHRRHRDCQCRWSSRRLYPCRRKRSPRRQRPRPTRQGRGASSRTCAARTS